MPAEKMARVEEYVCGRVGESGVGRVGGGGNSNLKTIQLKIKKSAMGRRSLPLECSGERLFVC
jgi:hypothetical protein